MEKFIGKFPAHFQAEAWRYLFILSKQGFDEEKTKVTITTKMNALIEEEAEKQEPLPERIYEFPKLEKVDHNKSTTSTKTLLETQTQNDLIYGYSTLIQGMLPTSKRYEQVIDPITDKVVALHDVSSDKKKEHLRHTRDTGKEIIVWSTTMPDPENFTYKEGKQFGKFISDIGVGLPYGRPARMILAYVFTEAVRTKSKIISLGRSIREPMIKMGIKPRAGEGRNVYQWIEQLYKLRYVTFSHTLKNKDVSLDETHSYADTASVYALFEHSSFWWDTDYAGGAVLVLDQRLFELLLDHSVPYDLRIMAQLYSKKSPLAMDIWQWCQYRLNDMLLSNTPLLRIPLGALFLQFTSERRIAHFEQDWKSALKILDSVVGDYNPVSYNEDKKMTYLSLKPATVLPKAKAV